MSSSGRYARVGEGAAGGTQQQQQQRSSRRAKRTWDDPGENNDEDVAAQMRRTRIIFRRLHAYLPLVSFVVLILLIVIIGLTTNQLRSIELKSEYDLLYSVSLALLAMQNESVYSYYYYSLTFSSEAEKMLNDDTLLHLQRTTVAHVHETALLSDNLCTNCQPFYSIFDITSLLSTQDRITRREMRYEAMQIEYHELLQQLQNAFCYYLGIALDEEHLRSVWLQRLTASAAAMASSMYYWFAVPSNSSQLDQAFNATALALNTHAISMTTASMLLPYDAEAVTNVKQAMSEHVAHLEEMMGMVLGDYAHMKVIHVNTTVDDFITQLEAKLTDWMGFLNTEYKSTWSSIKALVLLIVMVGSVVVLLLISSAYMIRDICFDVFASDAELQQLQEMHQLEASLARMEFYLDSAYRFDVRGMEAVAELSRLSPSRTSAESELLKLGSAFQHVFCYISPCITARYVRYLAHTSSLLLLDDSDEDGPGRCESEGPFLLSGKKDRNDKDEYNLNSSDSDNHHGWAHKQRAIPSLQAMLRNRVRGLPRARIVDGNEEADDNNLDDGAEHNNSNNPHSRGGGGRLDTKGGNVTHKAAGRADQALSPSLSAPTRYINNSSNTNNRSALAVPSHSVAMRHGAAGGDMNSDAVVLNTDRSHVCLLMADLTELYHHAVGNEANKTLPKTIAALIRSLSCTARDYGAVPMGTSGSVFLCGWNVALEEQELVEDAACAMLVELNDTLVKSNPNVRYALISSTCANGIVGSDTLRAYVVGGPLMYMGRLLLQVAEQHQLYFVVDNLTSLRMQSNVMYKRALEKVALNPQCLGVEDCDTIAFELVLMHCIEKENVMLWNTAFDELHSGHTAHARKRMNMWQHRYGATVSSRRFVKLLNQEPTPRMHTYLLSTNMNEIDLLTII